MTRNRLYNIYIASYAEDGGILHCVLSENGELSIKEKTLLSFPMYMEYKNNKMYVLLRKPFENNCESGLVTFDIDTNGKLINKSQIVSTKGECACHLTVEEKDVYITNYLSGSILKVPDKLMKHSGKGIHSVRQTSPHTHFVCLSPDEKYICVTDLGIDKVVFYTRDLDYCFDLSVPAGSGARHLVFSPDGKYMYVANELSSTVCVYKYCGKETKYLYEYKTLPETFQGESTVAAIRVHGDNLYVSNRGHNSISNFKIANGKLVLTQVLDCGGSSPRDFNMFGEILVCTNENSDNVTIFKINDGNISESINCVGVKHPLCVVGCEIV